MAGPAQVPAAEPTIEPTIVLDDPIVPADIPILCRRLAELVRADQGHRVICDAAALRAPDATAIEALARLQLTAMRHGSTLRLRRASAQLLGLLELVGLGGLIPPES